MIGTFSLNKTVWNRPILLVFIALYSIIIGLSYLALSFAESYGYWLYTFTNYPIAEHPQWYFKNFVPHLIGWISDILLIIAGFLLLGLKKSALIVEYILTTLFFVATAMIFNALTSETDFDRREVYEALASSYLVSMLFQFLIVFYIRKLVKNKILN